jgi:hypothetical protein
MLRQSAANSLDEVGHNGFQTLAHKSCPRAAATPLSRVVAVIRLGIGISSGKYFIGGLTIRQRYGRQQRCIGSGQFFGSTTSVRYAFDVPRNDRSFIELRRNLLRRLSRQLRIFATRLLIRFDALTPGKTNNEY